MPCFRPLNGYWSKTVNPTGKRSIVWSVREAHPELPSVTLPCGQCRFCRLEHSRQWALRCMHEASLYPQNSFLTLTYSPEHLPPHGSLDYEHPVLFMKRLRKYVDSYCEKHELPSQQIRSYGCAEYGEKGDRPHYHLCIFNWDFPDKKLWRKRRENPLYVSKDLESLWPFGHSSLGDVTFESAAYVARYVTKKITGARAPGHYEQVDERTGEIHEKLPERAICVSRRPGIGRTWLEKNAQFVKDHDFVVLRGKKVRPAKYYDRLFDIADPVAFEKVKKTRKENAQISVENIRSEERKAFANYYRKARRNWNVPIPKSRLLVMEEIQELQFKQLKRALENET